MAEKIVKNTSARDNSRVALFLPSFRFGGGERVMVDIANLLAERGFTVDLIAVSPVGQYGNQVDRRVTVISLGARRMTLALFPLISYLRHKRPAALMALSEHTHLLAVAAKMFAQTDTRIVLRIGTMLSRIQKTRTALRDRAIVPLSHWLYPKADVVIANSAGVARDVIDFYGVVKEKVVIIHNPKNVETIRAAGREPIPHPWLESKRTMPVIVAVGRFRVQKGFADLITAFALLQRSVPSRLIIVGEGREQKSLEGLVARLGVTEKVHFTGYVDNPHAYVAHADVFAMTSLWEGLPNALVEALICGTPVVATDCEAGSREILAPSTDPLVHIKTGVEWTEYGALVPVGGHAEIADALVRLLTDKELRERCSRAAEVRGGDFDSGAIITAYTQALGV